MIPVSLMLIRRPYGPCVSQGKGLLTIFTAMMFHPPMALQVNVVLQLHRPTAEMTQILMSLDILLVILQNLSQVIHFIDIAMAPQMKRPIGNMRFGTSWTILATQK